MLHPLDVKGIIPARAGFTSGEGSSCKRQRDHPRSRGVYNVTGKNVDNIEGSSPLARGLLRYLGGGVAGRRIIPARAGFTTRESTPRGRSRDHPRSRGVYVVRRGSWGETFGSSPLARGLREQIVVSRLHGGIIPARAGFTPRTRKEHNEHTDHPRSRGVYASFLMRASIS